MGGNRIPVPVETQSLPDTSRLDPEHGADPAPQLEDHVLITEDFATSAELERLDSAQSLGWSPGTQTVLRTATTNAKRAYYSPEPPPPVLESPSRISDRSRSHMFSPPSLLNPTSPTLLTSPSWPFASAREARFVAHYIKELSPWVCSCYAFSQE